MAEAVLDLVLQNLSSLIQNELSLFLGFHQDFQRLTSTLTAIKSTLEDAEEKQFSDRGIKDWLQKLKDAAYIIDDILDEFQYEQLAAKVHNSLFSSLHPRHIVFRRKIAKKMKSIRERLDEVAEERHKFGLMQTERRRTGDTNRRETASIIAQSEIYGREEEKNEIMDFLVGDASNFEEDLSIIPIVGMGGLGKTTLAQHIFNNDRVDRLFKPRIWVCVSDDFSLKKMTTAIIKSVSGESCEHLDLDSLLRKLQELLQTKRYLLVLDDVWDDDQENWASLRSVLACGAKGASILVTTRLPKVASIMGTKSPCQLSMLSEHDCWELFKHRAFGPNEIEHTDLAILGKEIVKKCGGVPLAAKALGGLLRFERDEKEWRYVLESKLWNLTQGENSVMSALRLSYLNLPLKLRQCFSICALFPKDTKIDKHFLINLWMANGFISSIERSKAEDIGDKMWNELYWRSFFQDIEKDGFGRITHFKMHDLIHDLAQFVADEVCCIEDSETSVSKRICHLSIDREAGDSIQLHQVKSLRTCIIQDMNDLQQSHDVFRCYSLRVLVCKQLNSLPSSISKLKHLRYLNLSNGNFATLPESLCELLNLQILNLNHCYRLQTLPNRLKCLKALRHLCLRNCITLSSLPRGIGELIFLKTLSVYIVGKQKGFVLEELGKLNLKGELHIKHLERVKSVMDAKDANMKSKHLTEFALSWQKRKESQVQETAEQILEVLQPDLQQLQTLVVEGYTGARFPEWMGSPSLKMLNSITLEDCGSCILPLALGKLPSLKELNITNMELVEYLDNDTYDVGAEGGYIAMEALILKRLPNLERLSKEDGESIFQHLSHLEIEDCPKLVLPCLPSLRKLYISGKCNQYLLSSINKSRGLESLDLRDNEELTCFPKGMLQDLTSLKTLEISWCHKLKVFNTWFLLRICTLAIARM
ncbi:hypothetical protein RIF29_24347 [Crotalaria pallida]|uniref:Disease resistance protein RGA3 n=1 Tax=Crotalaria pallida TaxID=3830 RepID=A0AAN9EK71_CROPI